METNNKPRETNTVETPVLKATIVMYTYITGRDSEYIEEPLFKAMSMKPSRNGRDMEMGEFDPQKVNESQHRAVEKVVKTINGDADNIVDTVLDMPVEDYNFIFEAVEEITKKK